MPGPVSRFALVVAAVVAAVGTASAQFGRQRPVEIDDVQIGLPPGRFVGERDATQKAAHVVRRNTWAPIYLRLKMIREVEGGAALRVETLDADDLTTTLVVPIVSNLSDRLPGSFVEPVELDQIPYVRTGDRNNGTVTVTVISTVDGSALSDPRPIRFLGFRDASNYVVLSLGSKLPGFDLPKVAAIGPQKNNNTPQPARGGLREGRVETAAITNVREMPDQWFGYAAADLVVLTTGSAPGDFLDELFDKEKSVNLRDRREALLEWVRRGGKLVISVGSNASKLGQFEIFRDLLPAPLHRDEPSRAAVDAELEWRARGGASIPRTLKPRTDTFPVAHLVLDPAKPARVLMPPPALDGRRAGDPLVVQAVFGLGRITVVGFDLDQSPFVDFAQRDQFWDWLIREAGSDRSADAPNRNNQSNYYGTTYYDTEDEFAAALRDHADNFEGVPVVSFGWVALFIVLYTLLIGPVEYLFLKKVLGRLELTWVTFPLIVLTVSAAAYFTAYAIKGKDLKVNKIDVVDVDLAGGRVYGRTWFTIFSPRIDSYTVSVEPKPEWTIRRSDLPPLVGWMGPNRGGGGGRVLSSGYRYHVGVGPRGDLHVADGLERVPIQVWSTKAFQAQWTGVANPGTPLVAADLFHPPGDPDTVTGSFVNNLPVEVLQDAVLIYRGKEYKLPALTPGQRVDVPPTSVGRRDGGLPTADGWLKNNAILPASNNQYTYNPSPTRSSVSLWGALFHEKVAATGQPLQNSSFRELDASWRVDEDNRNEAILLAKVETEPVPTGQLAPLAEDVMASPSGPSPTLLWLKGLPGGEKAREPVPGSLRQETYIRVFIPVKPASRR